MRRLLAESPTLGVRAWPVQRTVLDRAHVEVETAARTRPGEGREPGRGDPERGTRSTRTSAPGPRRRASPSSRYGPRPWRRTLAAAERAPGSRSQRTRRTRCPNRSGTTSCSSSCRRDRRGPEAHGRGAARTRRRGPSTSSGPGASGAPEGACGRAAHLGEVQVRGGPEPRRGSAGRRAPESGTHPVGQDPQTGGPRRASAPRRAHRASGRRAKAPGGAAPRRPVSAENRSVSCVRIGGYGELRDRESSPRTSARTSSPRRWRASRSSERWRPRSRRLPGPVESTPRSSPPS